jgi:mannose-1-phosphate guanylyltransferase
MKAMILCAGKGTRVRPLTYTVPKPMISLAGKPVLEFIVEHLVAEGFAELVINTSYLADSIEEYFRDGSRFGAKIAYSFEGRLEGGKLVGEALGSAGGMRRIQDFSGFFDETFAVLCGDAVVDVDLRAALAFHRRSRALATIVLKEVQPAEVSSYGVVALDQDGRISRFQEKPRQKEAVSTMANTGIYLFEPAIFEHIPPGVEFDIGSQLFPALVAARAPLYGFVMPFTWLDIGTVRSWWDATRTVLQGNLAGFRLPGNEVRPGVFCGLNCAIDFSRVEIVGPVLIGGSVRIEENCRLIGPTLIGSGSRLESGAEVNACIIDSYTRVSGVASLEEKIIFGNRCITPDGVSIDIAAHDISWLLGDARERPSLNPVHQALTGLAAELQMRQAPSGDGRPTLFFPEK